MRVLSDAGLEAIKQHKYKGGAYTPFDNFLNPFWFRMTELLPLWMAPNLVTLLALAHSAVSYGVLWWYCPSFCGQPPAWAYFLAAYCLWAYETLDAMDGKQARRTGASTPLGQLFDHGCDAAVSIFIHPMVFATLALSCGQTASFLSLAGMVLFQCLFYVAQWQEYHTGVLPTSYGAFGITEGHWIIMLSTVAAGIFGPIPDFELGGVSVKLYYAGGAIALIFGALLCGLFVTLKGPAVKTGTAVSQLLNPALVLAATVMFPGSVLEAYPRQLTLVAGVAMLRITVEMIVFSMAHMPTPLLNPSAVLYAALCVAAQYSDNGWMYPVAASLAVGELGVWVYTVIQEICGKLGIQCFRIQPKRQ